MSRIRTPTAVESMNAADRIKETDAFLKGFECGKSQKGTIDDCPYSRRESKRSQEWLEGFCDGGKKWTEDYDLRHDPNQNSVAFIERTRKDGRNFKAQEEVAYALTNPGSGGRAHSRSIASATMVRRLTPTECLRIQGYPDDYFDGLDFSNSVKYRMVGNSVAVPCVHWLAQRIARHLI